MRPQHDMKTKHTTGLIVVVLFFIVGPILGFPRQVKPPIVEKVN